MSDYCKYCFDTGTVRTKDKAGTVRVYACPCELGNSYRTPMYAPGDKEKKNPIVMPTYSIHRATTVTTPTAPTEVGHPSRLPYRDD